METDGERAGERLKAGVPVKVVAQRLGHAKTDITNDIYAHALPSMQKDAAAKMASLLT